MMRWTHAVLVGILLVGGCTNVAKMQKKYEAGDEKQLDKLIGIVARADYPYATRRSAARALGEIGSPRAVPVLSSVLSEFARRTTLKTEALKALGKIGDQSAVDPIGQLLDRSLSGDNGDLRQAALPALGQLGGEKAAGILFNALTYYDLVMNRKKRHGPRGVFTGQEQAPQKSSPSAPPTPPPPPGNLYDGQNLGTTNLFGSQPSPSPAISRDHTADERALTHSALVQIGPETVSVIEPRLGSKKISPSLREELMDILDEIRLQTESAAQE